MEYKPEMTPKVAVDLLPYWVWFWAPMYISATNLGPFSRGMLIHTSPAPAPSQGHSPLHQSFQQSLLTKQDFRNHLRCNRLSSSFIFLLSCKVHFNFYYFYLQIVTVQFIHYGLYLGISRLSSAQPQEHFPNDALSWGDGAGAVHRGEP